MLEQLAAEGFVPGRDVEVDLVHADERSPGFAQAADAVVSSRPDVIAVSGTNVTRVFQARTSEIPIVFRSVGDPVAAGLVKSLARPGGNITGESNLSFALEGKRLQVLQELRPQLQRVLVVMLEGPGSDIARRHLAPEARQLGIAVEELVLGRGDGSDDLERILARLVATRAEAVIFQTFSLTHRQFASTLAALEGRAIPAMFLDHRIVQRGGLVSLGVRNDFPDPASVRSIARILRGESPGSIPVAQSTRTHFALNLRTARAMKLVVPQSVLLRADEVID